MHFYNTAVTIAIGIVALLSLKIYKQPPGVMIAAIAVTVITDNIWYADASVLMMALHMGIVIMACALGMKFYYSQRRYNLRSENLRLRRKSNIAMCVALALAYVFPLSSSLVPSIPGVPAMTPGMVVLFGTILLALVGVGFAFIKLGGSRGRPPIPVSGSPSSGPPAGP